MMGVPRRRIILGIKVFKSADITAGKAGVYAKQSRVGVASSAKAPLLTIHNSGRRCSAQGGACLDAQTEVANPSR